jgi:hypothetical protein
MPLGVGEALIIFGGFRQVFGAVNDFRRNRRAMMDANTHGADKFFHCMANCEATQRGELGRLTAHALSDIREASDFVVNHLRGMSTGAIIDDIREDQAANRAGREGAAAGGACTDVCETRRPNGL